MSKKYFCLILSIFISLSLHAQKQELDIDSLLTSYRSLKEDTNKVKQLIRISWACNDINKLDESIKYAQQALELASKLNWKKGILRGYAVLGDNYMYKRDNF